MEKQAKIFFAHHLLNWGGEEISTSNWEELKKISPGVRKLTQLGRGGGEGDCRSEREWGGGKTLQPPSNLTLPPCMDSKQSQPTPDDYEPYRFIYPN